MLLTAAQILAAPDKKTVVVPVPEWGEGAEVLVGSMGALARAEMEDWFQGIGRVPGPADDETGVVTCDSPPDDEISHEARIVLLEQAVQDLLAALEEDLSAQEREALTARIQKVLDGDVDAPKVYTTTENIEAMVRYCAASILDPETRKPAFTSAQVQDLGDKDHAALSRVYVAALDLNRATRPAAKAFEKNSDRTSDGDSGGA